MTVEDTGADGATTPMSLLIVDDDPITRGLLQEHFGRDGHFQVVGEAGNGEEAIDVARATQPDVVLMDIVMPRMDGPTAVPLVKEVSPQSAVVLSTGIASRTDVPLPCPVIEKQIRFEDFLRDLLDAVDRARAAAFPTP